MPTNPRACPFCGCLVLASSSTEYRDSPDDEHVTSTVVRYQCQCGHPFSCSFAESDRDAEDTDLELTVLADT